LVAFAALRLTAPGSVGRLVKEDGALEYLQVLLYGAAGVLALFVWMSLRGRGVRWTFLALAAACFVVAAEEVSWGERLLGYAPPPFIRQFNTRPVMSLHNLAPVQRVRRPAYVAAGLVGAFGWWLAVRLPPGRASGAAKLALPDRFTL